jgi:hypothetical protein
VVVSQQRHDVFRVRTFSEPGEPAQVPEQRSYLSSMAFKLLLGTGRDNQISYLWRQKSPQPAQPLDFAYLVGDALFELLVELGELLGLRRVRGSSPRAAPKTLVAVAARGRRARRVGCAQRLFRYLTRLVRNHEPADNLSSDRQAAGGYVTFDKATAKYSLGEEHELCLADPAGPVDLPARPC